MLRVNNQSTQKERKSCETCRSRKLRCSGEKSGCSRCRSLSLTCRFKDKGAPGRPRKRAVAREQAGEYGSVSGSSTVSSTSSSSHSHVSSILPHPVPQMTLGPMPMGGHFDSLPSDLSSLCGFDALPRGLLLGDSDICTFPIESWRTPQYDILQSEPYVSPVSLPPSCKCDEEVSGIIRNLSHASMSHDVIQTLRAGVSLTERLLTCPICYDVSKPPRVTVQNVLLIGHLMFEVTSGYKKYLRWLNERDRENQNEQAHETIYLGSRLGGVDLQISSDKVKELVMHGLQSDVERLLIFGKTFAQRQRNRHMVGHETCPDAEGRCRREQDGRDRDPLDVCPHHPVARGLVPCFRIVDEVRGMIQQVADSLS
ncbi:hypothetical protein BJY04DRAFT_230158 [Aspergillus karnatakaensis]|uniref:Zn(II)2Cys6 transcription factor domain-containing protein n=1 Tax=Aspergillus karnatakaensis TaxID=1810916 RepID=UPI003CCE0F08